MSFALNASGLGCYALIYKGDHIGSVFSSEHDGEKLWLALIHDSCAARMRTLPVPFTERQHQFRTLQDLKAWLGLALAAPGPERGSTAEW